MIIHIERSGKVGIFITPFPPPPPQVLTTIISENTRHIQSLSLRTWLDDTCKRHT